MHKPRATIMHVTEARETAGTERSLLMLLDHADTAAFEHIVILRSEGSFADELKRRQIATVRVPRAFTGDPTSLLRFAATLIRHRPDIVHIHGGRLEAVIARAFGVPVVERKNVCRNQFYRPALNTTWADRFLNRFVNVSIAPADAVKQHYIARGYQPGNIHVVPNGVEPSAEPTQPERQAERERLGLSKDAFVLAFAGRLMPEKGLNVLFAALAQLPVYVQCVIMGDGPRREEYTRMVNVVGLAERVLFTGHLANVRGVMACADAVVVPSLSEPLANAALEGMAEGRPVIASDIEGMPEVIEHKVNGLLVPPGDPKALARAIATLAENPVHARMMGEAGKSKTRTILSPADAASVTEDIYRKLLHAYAGNKSCSERALGTSC